MSCGAGLARLSAFLRPRANVSPELIGYVHRSGFITNRDEKSVKVFVEVARDEGHGTSVECSLKELNVTIYVWTYDKLVHC